MKRLSILVAALAVGAVQAHPLLIEETEVIPNPDPTMEACCNVVAIDGDDAIFVARQGVDDPEPGSQPDTRVRAFHLHRASGAWSYVAQLGEWMLGNEDDAPTQFTVDMRDGVAAVVPGYGVSIYEREGGSYVPHASQYSNGVPTRYVQIDAGRIFFGDGTWGGSLRRRAADGTWPVVAYMYAGYSGDGDNANGGPVAFSGASAAVLEPYNIDELPAPALVMFRNTGGDTWQQTQRIAAAPGHSLGLMTMSGDVMYVQDDPRYGALRYYRSTADGLWRPSGLALRADGDHRMLGTFGGGGDWRVAIGDNFVLRRIYDFDKRADVVQVFQYVAANVLGHVATLAASDGSSLGDHISVDGRTILIGGAQKAYLFQIPSQPRAPALIQHTFDGSTATGWQVVSGQFAVTQGANSRVYRQSNTTSDATTVLTAANWTQQVIQADVTPTAINGTDRWVGLATRRSNAANYYYVTLRSSGIIVLKRMYQGAFATLDSASLPFALNRTYRLRLESVGTRQRVYVDGVLVLEALDSDLELGRPALLTNRAAADFDNVIASPADRATLWERGSPSACGQNCAQVAWTTADGDWSWQTEGNNQYFTQSSLTTAGRAPAGAITRNLDQTVDAHARVRTFGAGSDPWFGLMARYADLNNYVYLSLRRSNTVTLRKVVNGQIQELGSASLPVTAGAWYQLRLDAVGDRLRAFVNGRQLLEAVDTQPTPGQVGVVTNRAQADFDDFIAVRP